MVAPGEGQDGWDAGNVPSAGVGGAKVKTLPNCRGMARKSFSLGMLVGGHPVGLPGGGSGAVVTGPLCGDAGMVVG